MATRNETQGFIWKEVTWPPGLLERKNNNKVVSFSALFFMFTTWIIERLDRKLADAIGFQHSGKT